MGEDVNVTLAQLSGQITALTQVVELRMRTQERDLEGHRNDAVSVHRTLAEQLESNRIAIQELQQFKQKMAGVAIGLSLASGTVSGLLVALFTNLGAA